MNKRVTKKNLFIAVVLSILLPGSGQVYNGQKHKTIFGYSIFFGLPAIFFFLKLQFYFWGLCSLMILLLIVYVLNIADAVYGAIKSNNVSAVRISKWFIALPFVILAIDVYAISPVSNILGIRAFKIMGGSMAPTLQVGDFVVSDVRQYGSNKIDRGEIIHFRHKQHKLLIKRVIAVSGEVVKSEGNKVFINGVLLDEPYAQFIGSRKNIGDFNKRHKTADFGAVTVPEGRLFVMGDNRDNSFDSRDSEFGFVEKANVTGRPLYINWSRDKSRIGRKIK